MPNNSTVKTNDNNTYCCKRKLIPKHSSKKGQAPPAPAEAILPDLEEFWLTFFLIGLATTLTRSMMIGFFDVLPVYILMGMVIVMMFYEAFIDKK